MGFQTIRRVAGYAAAVTVGAFVGALVLAETAYGPPGAAPVHVVDAANVEQAANVDANGSLQVAGEVSVGGTASVNVANTPLPVSGTVNVGNFPTEQDVDVVGSVDVTVPAASAFARHLFLLEAGELEAVLVDPMYVSLLTLRGGGDDEMVLCLKDNGVERFCIGDVEVSIGPFVTVPLTQPIRVDEVTVSCKNESEDCIGEWFLVGS